MLHRVSIDAVYVGDASDSITTILRPFCDSIATEALKSHRERLPKVYIILYITTFESFGSSACSLSSAKSILSLSQYQLQLIYPMYSRIIRTIRVVILL